MSGRCCRSTREPIVYQDGAQKNDCELIAAKRLVGSLAARYPELKFLLVEDSLYADAPHLREVRERGWHFIVTVKPEQHRTLFKQFEWRVSNAAVQELGQTSEDGTKERFRWRAGLFFSNSATDVTVNFLSYETTDPKGRVRRWTCATSLPHNRRNVAQVMRAGRSRWKIENETFNTLKNRGYHFEHNYGHGEKWLASVLALLMMLAFLVDQIQERCCELFKQLRSNLRTRAKLWETMRSLFKVVPLCSMSDLYARMAELYEIQLR